MKTTTLSHIPVFLKEILELLPSAQNGSFLDVTGGGAGHSCEILKARPSWTGVIQDRDPEAIERIQKRLSEEKLSERANVRQAQFTQIDDGLFDFVLADLGISSFQLDDPTRGLSLFSEQPPDFRMNPFAGKNFAEWINGKSAEALEEIFRLYGEEPKARKLAQELKKQNPNEWKSARILAQTISSILSYSGPSEKHPATRAFQAFRIAVNEELPEIDALLAKIPEILKPGGVFAAISFHSLEDRKIKRSFEDLASDPAFVILNKKPWVPSEEEQRQNPRSRSAKLRALKRTDKLNEGTGTT
jgi:16S rRNA (cytosine1402-N4)-methyltransferase